MCITASARLFRFATLIGVLTWTVSAFAQVSTYYIDEDTNYENGNKCDVVTVNTITSSLQTQLNADGWTGQRWTEFSAWPQDFWEASSSVYGTSGADSYYGDNGAITVFAGHGAAHHIHFSNTGNEGVYNGSTQCDTDMQYNARLGELAGAKAGFGMWLACEVVQVSELASIWELHRLQQIVGFTGDAVIGDGNAPLDFYNETATSSNVTAWDNVMSSQGAGPIIATFSNISMTQCWGTHDESQLKYGGGTYTQTSNPQYVCYSTWPGT